MEGLPDTVHGNFSIPYACVFVAMVMPYLWVTAARIGTRHDNAAPRPSSLEKTGWRQRANWAHFNAFEAFPSFAAAVAFARFETVPSYKVANFALAFVVFRILHGAFYIANKSTLRSLSWAMGFACTIRIFILAF